MARNRERLFGLAVAAGVTLSGTVVATAATAAADGDRAAAPSPWQVYPVQVDPEPGETDQLEDVEAASASLAFAVGRSENDPLLVKWDGVSWKEVQFFPPNEADSALLQVHRVNANSWWAVGYSGEAPWVARYKDGTWSHFSTVGLPPQGVAAISTTSSGVPVVVTANGCCTGDSVRARVAKWTGTKWVLQKLPRPSDKHYYSSAAEIRRIPGTSDRFVIIGSTQSNVSRPWAVRGQAGGSWEDFSPPSILAPPSDPPAFTYTYIEGADSYVGSRSDVTWVGSLVSVDDAIPPGEDLPLYRAFATRWDGTKWTKIQLPTVGGDSLAAIAVQPGKSRLITGFNGSARVGIAFEYKPSTGWVRLTSSPKDSGLLGVAAIPGTAEFWAVGHKGPAGNFYYTPTDPYVLKH